ncbi:hypothetical protein N7478_002159 [Penicillium angulare]|uniref:uncharacterized protein n=1 Tax=Penicillium angulare TaxID=116970 RepID=UPI00253FBF3C|nr:uncharacterized protein N7478_002159 [Penicillium angulare]KAJ5289129.1 hypothetical protein N7478_002159 [Penicillium angulare]
MQHLISRRAQDAAEEASQTPIWDVLSDAWCASTNPNGFVNVGVAENSLMHNELLTFLNNKLELPAQYLTYNDGNSGSNRLRASMAGFLNRQLKPFTPLNADHLVVTNGVSPAIEHVSWAFTDPGEGILLGRPYYGTFIPDMMTRPRATVVPVSFEECDPLSLEGVAKYETALLNFQEETGKKVRSLMLCHPHNPLGRCYSREVLIELMRFCQKYQIHLISDEIYALSVWENTVDEYPPPVKFESALSIDLNGIIDPRLVHVLWGVSKDFGANGLRMGVIISQVNEDLHSALRGASLYTTPSGLADHLMATLFDDSTFMDAYIQESQRRLSQSYAFTVDFLREHGITYAPGANAAFFVWVDLGKRYRELHPSVSDNDSVGDKVMDLLLKHKVFLASGALFGSEKDGWFRIVFTQSKEYLVLALERIVAALQDEIV